MNSDQPKALPDRFHFVHRGQDVALCLGERMIALLVVMPDGGARCQRNIGTLELRTDFHDDVDAGMRFLAAWARRWEARILDQYRDASRGQVAAAGQPTHFTPDPSISLPARKRRRRKQ